MVDITNESHVNPAVHQYTVSIDDAINVTDGLHLPAPRPPDAFCKHVAAVENATDDGTRPSVDA